MNSTFVNGLEVLEALASSARPRGVTELSEQLGLAKSQVHRLLQTLTQRGYVRQNVESGRYSCTLRMWEHGALVADRIDVRKIATPHLQKLAERTSETVHLSVLDGDEALYIDKIDSPQPVRAYSRVGGRAPAYAVATGKAQLAYAPPKLLENIKLQRYTVRTIATVEGLRKELERIREDGYAVNRGEWNSSVCGLAVPIFGADRKVAAAVGISGPLERLSPGKLRSLAPVVIGIGRELSRELGFHGQPGVPQ